MVLLFLFFCDCPWLWLINYKLSRPKFDRKIRSDIVLVKQDVYIDYYCL